MEKEDRKKLVQIIYKKRYLPMNILYQEAGISCPKHCVKSVCIRSYSRPYFPAFGLNTERYSISLRRIQSECGKILTRVTLNMDNFYAVIFTILAKFPAGSKHTRKQSSSGN